MTGPVGAWQLVADAAASVSLRYRLRAQSSFASSSLRTSLDAPPRAGSDPVMVLQGGERASGCGGAGDLPIGLDGRRAAKGSCLAGCLAVTEQSCRILDPLRRGLRNRCRETVPEEMRGDALAELLLTGPGDAAAELVAG